MKSVSLVVPCYNEETNLQKGVLDKIGNYVINNKQFAEVIIVDDGSTDDSTKIIKERYLPHFPQFKLVENQHKGKAYAVMAGIEKAKSEYVMFMDIDLATPVEESEKLISRIDDGYEIIIGSRKSHREGAPLSRRIMALGMILVRDVFIGLRGIKDTQCGFKLFEKKASIKIMKNLQVFNKQHTIQGSSVSAAFDLEFLFLAVKYGYSVIEIPVTWRHVETKNVNFIKDTFETLVDISRIKYYDLTGRYSITKR